MGYRMYDFRCDECDTVHEALAVVDADTDPCPQCQHPAKRIISPVRCKLDPISGDFPGATMKWERDHVKGGQTSD